MKDFVTPFICDMSREISDDEAEIEIKSFIKSLRDEGVEEFNLLDVGLELNIPMEQIDRILEKLRKTGKQGEIRMKNVIVGWKCNECGTVVKNHKDDGNYNDCPDEDCCGCLTRC